MKITLGADPELFLVDQHDNLRSSIGRVGGSKEIPRALDIGTGFFVQEDNVAVEFNIPPAETMTAFVNSIELGLEEIQKLVEKQGLKTNIVASASFPESELQHPRARMFGCEPDYNAWTKSVNPRPVATNRNLRSCGGHIHVGFSESPGNKDTMFDMIRAMDLFLGVPSVMMDRDTVRRELYGKAGAHRVTNYGFEYRVLSNFWIESHKHRKWAWGNTMRAIDWIRTCATKAHDELISVSGDIQKAINNTDILTAQSLIARYNLDVC